MCDFLCLYKWRSLPVLLLLAPCGSIVHVDETGCVSPFVCLFNVMTHTKNNNTIIIM